MDLVKEGISNRNVVILVGNCRVNYAGRASSTLEFGERIMMIKEDGSVLVHRPSGYVPVNWQPAGCFFQTAVVNNCLRIRASRRKPIESVDIIFDRIFFLSLLKLIDKGDFSLHASESDMQKAILIDPSLFEEGFKIISFEKKIEPGFVDLYGIDRNGRLVIIELKRRTAGRDSALQLAKYVESIKMVSNRELRGVLVAPRLAKGMKILLANLGLEFKAIEPKICGKILQKNENPKLFDFFNSN